MCADDLLIGVISGVISTVLCSFFIFVCRKIERNKKAKLNIKNLSWVLWDDFVKQYKTILIKEKDDALKRDAILYNINSTYTSILTETEFLFRKSKAQAILIIIRNLKRYIRRDNCTYKEVKEFLQEIQKLKEFSDKL